TNDMKIYVILNLNRRIPNGTYGGVRGRGLITPSYSIYLGRGRGDRYKGQSWASCNAIRIIL
ncbi:hypothetical protein V7103_23295, partial [Neobacillus drentensis]